MTILLFGTYIQNYPRTHTIKFGLSANNINFIECHTRRQGLSKYFELWRQHKKFKGKYDKLLVMWSGQNLVWLAKLISNKPIIYDIFVSLYLTNIYDRKNCTVKSYKAKKYKFLDWWPAFLADNLILDTQAQINYFKQNYPILKHKTFFTLYTSCHPNKFSPSITQSQNKKFIIGWHGHIVPFHGLDVIINAAKLLAHNSDISFKIVTRFNSRYQKYKQLVDKLNLNNLEFIEELSYPEGINQFINSTDLMLGIFGNNLKGELVIPNKHVEIIACAKPLLTAETKAIKEIFNHQENIYLIKNNNPQILANAILELKENNNLRQKIADNGYQLFKEKLLPQIQIKKLIKFL